LTICFGLSEFSPCASTREAVSSCRSNRGEE
jgi:hypothetical protein